MASSLTSHSMNSVTEYFFYDAFRTLAANVKGEEYEEIKQYLQNLNIKKPSTDNDDENVCSLFITFTNIFFTGFIYRKWFKKKFGIHWMSLRN